MGDKFTNEDRAKQVEEEAKNGELPAVQPSGYPVANHGEGATDGADKDGADK